MSTLNKFRVMCKENKFLNCLYNILKFFYYKLYILIIARKCYPKIHNTLTKIDIRSMLATANELIYSTKSLGRFGDGEFSWIMGKTSGLNSFEKPSKELSERLQNVLTTDDDHFMIGLPNQFRSLNNYKKPVKNYWIRCIITNIRKIIPFLNTSHIFYNADVTRPYMDFINKKDSGLIFYLMKKIWNNKKVLIIEGCQSRVGVKDDLLANALEIKRIECPSKNAFELYNKILKSTISFLSNHKDYISLISLGPTATILAYDLFKDGYRAIDIGNIDIEYNWYKLGVNKKIDLPYKYVNELIKGQNTLSIKHDYKYNNEIIEKLNEK